jgi:hypothetical protein
MQNIVDDVYRALDKDKTSVRADVRKVEEFLQEGEPTSVFRE